MNHTHTSPQARAIAIAQPQPFAWYFIRLFAAGMAITAYNLVILYAS